MPDHLRMPALTDACLCALLQAKLPVVGAGALPAGDYKWPFAFQLPANCPGSFSYSSGDSSNAR